MINGRIIGVILTGHDGRRGIIHHMCVHPDFRRMGVAAHLVSLAEKALKKEGNQYYVLVLVGTSSVSKTYVKVGGQNAGSVWITEGLEEGQTLVIE